MAATAGPGVVISHANGATPALGSLFDGICFFVLRRVPLRADYMAKIQANGGRIVQLEAAAKYIVADHLRKDSPPGSISYTFIDAAIEQGAIPDPTDHRAGPAPGTQRPVGSTVVPAKGTRTPFTAQDDKDLWEWVEKYRRRGGSVKGLDIYKQLEAVNPRHTTQSWRDRYIHKLLERRPDGAKSPEPEDDQLLQDLQATARREAATQRSPRNGNAARDATGSSTPTQGVRTRFTLEDDQDLWNWVEKCKRKGNGFVKGNEIYKQLEVVNKRHSYQAWRDRYIKHLLETPPEGVEVSTGRNSEENEQDIKFKDEDFNALMENASDIERVEEDQLDEAWDAWQENQSTEHTANDWRDFWLAEVRPVYIEQKKRQEARVSRIRTEGSETKPKDEELGAITPSKARASQEKGEDIKTLPANGLGEITPEKATSVNTTSARTASATSPLSTQKRKRETPTPRAKTYGRKRVRGATEDLVGESYLQEEDPQPAVRRSAARERRAVEADGNDVVLEFYGEPDDNGIVPGAAAFDASSDPQEVLPSSDARSADLSSASDIIEDKNAKGDSMQVEPSALQETRPTSEAIRAAPQQSAVENRAEVNAKSAIDGVQALTADINAFLTSEANRNAAEQLTAEAQIPESGPVEAEGGQTTVSDAIPNMSPERTSLIALTASQLSHQQPDVDLDIVPAQGNALTEANLASQQAQHKTQLLRGTDLPEDEDEEDQGQYVGYLQNLLGVKPSPDQAVTDIAKHQQPLEADEVELESDRELTPQSQQGLASGSRWTAIEGELAQPGDDIVDVFTQNLDWPLSPQKPAKTLPVQTESQSFAFETQMQCPNLAEQALQSYVQPDEEPGSALFRDAVGSPALQIEAPSSMSKPPIELPAPSPKAAHAEVASTASLTVVAPPVTMVSATALPAASKPRSQPLSQHHWSKAEDRAIARAMRLSSRASDTLAMLDLKGRSLPAIRRRSAMLLKESPRLLSGWDGEPESEDELGDEEVEIVDSAETEKARNDDIDFSVPEHEGNGEIDLSVPEPDEDFESDEDEMRDERDGMQPGFPDLDGEFGTNSADLRDGDDADDEIDLTVPEPEGGFDFYSQEDAQAAESSAQALDGREDVGSAEQPIEHIGISSEKSSASSSSPDSSDDEESQSHSNNRINFRTLDTQAVLAAESQGVDLSMPLPPDSDLDSESEDELPTDPLQVPASSRSQIATLDPPYSSTKIASATVRPLKSSAPISSLRQVGSTHRQAYPSTAPSSTNRISPRKVLKSRLSHPPAPPPPTSESVPAFRYRLLTRGYTSSAIYSALKRTSMDTNLAELVLIEERQGRSVDDVKGVWTKEEDEIVVGGNAAALKGLWERHGYEGAQARVEFLQAMSGV